MYSVKIIDQNTLESLQDGTFNHRTEANPLFVQIFKKYSYINQMNLRLEPGEEYYVQASVINSGGRLVFHLFGIETYKEVAERISTAEEHLKG